MYEKKVLIPYSLRFVKMEYEPLAFEMDIFSKNPGKYGDKQKIELVKKVVRFKALVKKNQLQGSIPNGYRILISFLCVKNKELIDGISAHNIS